MGQRTRISQKRGPPRWPPHRPYWARPHTHARRRLEKGNVPVYRKCCAAATHNPAQTGPVTQKNMQWVAVRTRATALDRKSRLNACPTSPCCCPWRPIEGHAQADADGGDAAWYSTRPTASRLPKEFCHAGLRMRDNGGYDYYYLRHRHTTGCASHVEKIGRQPHLARLRNDRFGP